MQYLIQTLSYKTISDKPPGQVLPKTPSS